MVISSLSLSLPLPLQHAHLSLRWRLHPAIPVYPRARALGLRTQSRNPPTESGGPSIWPCWIDGGGRSSTNLHPPGHCIALRLPVFFSLCPTLQSEPAPAPDRAPSTAVLKSATLDPPKKRSHWIHLHPNLSPTRLNRLAVSNSTAQPPKAPLSPAAACKKRAGVPE